MKGTVRVYYGAGTASQEYAIPAKSSHTYQFGADCPSSLKGVIWTVWNKYVRLKSTDMNGTPWSETDAGLNSCWNTHFQICQKSGQGYTEVRDDDYSFCIIR